MKEHDVAFREKITMKVSVWGHTRITITLNYSVRKWLSLSEMAVLRWLNTVLSVFEYVIGQIMARERLQLTSENLASGKFTDQDFDWQVKYDVFVVSMAPWTIEYNLKISLLSSLHKICSLDSPINLQFWEIVFCVPLLFSPPYLLV